MRTAYRTLRHTDRWEVPQILECASPLVLWRFGNVLGMDDGRIRVLGLFTQGTNRGKVSRHTRALCIPGQSAGSQTCELDA